MTSPVTVLTGFLGAGKTTLLNQALKDPFLSGTWVIVNERGGDLPPPLSRANARRRGAERATSDAPIARP